MRPRCRPGHHRPIGSVARERFVDWKGPEPRLLTYAIETYEACSDPMEVERAFLVVGIEERKGGQWTILLERISWDSWVELVENASDDWLRRNAWTFYRIRRKAPRGR